MYIFPLTCLHFELHTRHKSLKDVVTISHIATYIIKFASFFSMFVPRNNLMLHVIICSYHNVFNPLLEYVEIFEKNLKGIQ